MKAAQPTIEPEWGFGPDGERILLNGQAMLDQDEARERTGGTAAALAAAAAAMVAPAPALVATGTALAGRVGSFLAIEGVMEGTAAALDIHEGKKEFEVQAARDLMYKRMIESPASYRERMIPAQVEAMSLSEVEIAYQKEAEKKLVGQLQGLVPDGEWRKFVEVDNGVHWTGPDTRKGNKYIQKYQDTTRGEYAKAVIKAQERTFMHYGLTDKETGDFKVDDQLTHGEAKRRTGLEKIFKTKRFEDIRKGVLGEERNEQLMAEGQLTPEELEKLLLTRGTWQRIAMATGSIEGETEGFASKIDAGLDAEEKYQVSQELPKSWEREQKRREFHAEGLRASYIEFLQNNLTEEEVEIRRAETAKKLFGGPENRTSWSQGAGAEMDTAVGPDAKLSEIYDPIRQHLYSQQRIQAVVQKAAIAAGPTELAFNQMQKDSKTKRTMRKGLRAATKLPGIKKFTGATQALNAAMRGARGGTLSDSPVIKSVAKGAGKLTSALGIGGGIYQAVALSELGQQIDAKTGLPVAGFLDQYALNAKIGRILGGIAPNLNDEQMKGAQNYFAQAAQNKQLEAQKLEEQGYEGTAANSSLQGRDLVRMGAALEARIEDKGLSQWKNPDTNEVENAFESPDAQMAWGLDSLTAAAILQQIKGTHSYKSAQGKQLFTASLVSQAEELTETIDAIKQGMGGYQGEAHFQGGGGGVSHYDPDLFGGDAQAHGESQKKALALIVQARSQLQKDGIYEPVGGHHKYALTPVGAQHFRGQWDPKTGRLDERNAWPFPARGWQPRSNWTQQYLEWTKAENYTAHKSELPPAGWATPHKVRLGGSPPGTSLSNIRL